MKSKFVEISDPIEYIIDYQLRSNFCLIGLPIPSKHGGVDNSIEDRLIGAIDRKYNNSSILHKILYLIKQGYNVGEISIVLRMDRRTISKKIKELSLRQDIKNEEKED